MKRSYPHFRLLAVISLLLGAIWLNPAAAATVPQLTWLGEWSGGLVAGPRALDVDGQGNLYVADQLSRAVFKFDRFGRCQTSFLDGQASGRGVAVTPDGGTLYVSTKSQGVAVVSVADGTVSGYLTGAELTTPAEIDLDVDGYVYVADASRFDVKVFYPNGSLKAVFGGAGIANGQFRSIAALAVNPQNGQAYVASNLAEIPRLQIFDKSGAYLSSVPNATLYGVDNHTARGIVFENRADGRAFVLRYLPVALRAFDASFATALADFGDVSGKLHAPVDVAFDAVTNRLFVSDGSGIDVFGVDGGSSPAYTNSAPSAPALLSPVAGTVVAGAAPVLTWGAATDADGDKLSYEVVVTRGDAVVYKASTVATSQAVPAGTLEENGSYQWTVTAADGLASSAPGAKAAFVVNATDEAPSAPVAVSPLAGEAFGDADSLVWTASVDPDPNDALLSYRVEIAADAAFADVVVEKVVDGQALQLSVANAANLLEVGASYFWRVAAADADGTASSASAAGSFVYDAMLLRVTANVQDAVVSLYGNHGYAGRLAGKTPLVLRDLAAGRYTVVVERAGFEPVIESVELTEGASAAVNAAMSPAYDLSTFAAGTISVGTGPAAGAGAAPLLVDFDGDGRLDLLVGDAAGQLLLFPALDSSAGDSLAFQGGASLGLPVMPGAVPYVADWNNDGLKDLLVGQADGTVKLFVNAGSDAAPAFAGATDLAISGGTLNVVGGASPVVVDLNGDGAKDLVVGSASGKVYAFINQGSDAAPQLAVGAPLFEVAGAAQVASVDWNADGVRDLLVTANGQSTVYLKGASGFAAAGALPVSGVFGVAAVDLNNGSGKDLVVGKADGKLAFFASDSKVYAGSTLAYLQTAWTNAAALVADENPAALALGNKISADLAAGSYETAKTALEGISAQLNDGEAKASVQALAGLLK